MTPEELLKPRYKVIADYPESPYKIGDIEFNGTWSDNDSLANYPSIFRKLEWWEERDVKDMPGYLKDTGDGEVFKVREWLDYSMAVIWLNKNKKINHTGFHQANTEHFLPATESEYNEYIKSKV